MLKKTEAATLAQPSKTILLLLVAMTGIAPIALYMLVPALPTLAVTFDRDISIAQMTVSLFMVGIAISQMVMGPLSDKFGRKPVLLAGLGLAVVATIGCAFAATLPQLIVWRFLQALGGATGMVISRAIIRDLYTRERVGGMISLVIAVMMIVQMLSPLMGGLIETAYGWRAIFYALAAASVLIVLGIAVALPETRRRAPAEDLGFRRDVGALFGSRAFVGYVLCYVFASALIFVFAGAGPFIVVNQMGRTSAEYGAWFATSGLAYLTGNLFSARFSPRIGIERMIWIGLAIQISGAALNLVFGLSGINQAAVWLFGAHMLVTFGNAFVMSNTAAGAISIRPYAAGAASGIMGFSQMGFGSLISQGGAYLGGHFATPLPMNIALFAMSLACAAMMLFIVPRRPPAVTAENVKKAEEEETALL